jgi:uncharacterized short protein YbdD (DUF466 family)
MLTEWLKRLWRFLREVSGDDAYERYLRHCAEKHRHLTPISRKTFFCREQARKWNGVNHCC